MPIRPGRVRQAGHLVSAPGWRPWRSATSARAVALATATTGRPSITVLICKDVDARAAGTWPPGGQRARPDLAVNPRAALSFSWPSRTPDPHPRAGDPQRRRRPARRFLARPPPSRPSTRRASAARRPGRTRPRRRAGPGPGRRRSWLVHPDWTLYTLTPTSSGATRTSGTSGCATAARSGCAVSP